MAAAAIVERIEDHYRRTWSMMGGAVGGEVIERPDAVVCRAALDHAPYNHVLRCSPNEDAEALIDEIWDLLGPREAVWTITSRCGPPDLDDRLLARGCRPYSTLTGMIRRADGGPPVEAPPSVSVEEVTPDLLETWIDLVLDQWHLADGDRATLVAMHHELGFERVRRFLCFADGEPVAKASLAVYEPATVGVYGVGTKPEHRGHGYGTLVTEEALRRAAGVGAVDALLHSTPVAVGVYEALGFEAHCTLPVFLKPGAEPPARPQVERMARV